MRKSIISLFIVLAMSLSFVSCEEKENPEKPDQPAEQILLEDLLGGWHLETTEVVTYDASGKEIDRQKEVSPLLEIVLENDGKGFEYYSDIKDFRDFTYTYADGALTIKPDGNPSDAYNYGVEMKDGNTLALSLNVTGAGPREASVEVSVYAVYTYSRMEQAPTRPDDSSITKDTILGKWGIIAVSEEHFDPKGNSVYENKQTFPEMDYMYHNFVDYENGYVEYVGGGGGDGREGFDFTYTFDPESMKLNMVAYKEDITYDVSFEDDLMHYKMFAEYMSGSDKIKVLVTSTLKKAAK